MPILNRLFDIRCMHIRIFNGWQRRNRKKIEHWARVQMQL